MTADRLSGVQHSRKTQHCFEHDGFTSDEREGRSAECVACTHVLNDGSDIALECNIDNYGRQGIESRLLLLQLQRAFHGTLCLTSLGETASLAPTNNTADGGTWYKGCILDA